MSNEIKKKVFLIVSGKPERITLITDYINLHYDKPIIYNAPNGNVGLLKIKNAAIDIVISDSKNNTADAIRMIELILLEKNNQHTAIVIIGHPPEEVKFLDELVTGKIYFIDDQMVEKEFVPAITKALNFNSQNESSAFRLRYLSAGDLLIKEGDKAEFVYIVKHGQLCAYNLVNSKKVPLGNIEMGEFVGEMSYISNEPRSANIEAITDAELIEIPIGLLDKVLYKRPAWSKALMQTLSKRLKDANKLTQS